MLSVIDMKTELEHLKVCLLLAERIALHDLAKGSGAPRGAALDEIRSAIEAFNRLEERYNALESQTPPEWQKTNWHMTVMANVPFGSTMAEIFAQALRQLPWPQGIVVRLARAEQYGGYQHEFVVHHESQEAGIGMEVIDER